MMRDRGIMSDDLFHRIIKEGKELRTKLFFPFLNGEPFLHPKVFEWLDYMEAEGAPFCLFTNASLLNKEKIDKLITYKCLRYMMCSINAATKETHEKVMGLKNFDTVVENVRYLLEKAPFKVVASFVLVNDNKHEARQFSRMWRGHNHMNSFTNWGGCWHDPMEMTGEKGPCNHLLSNVFILWDGKVNLCCMDYDGRVILGDINKQSIEEVWNSMETLRIRHQNLDFDMELCRDCNVICKRERYVRDNNERI
jgi:radical SAM protein with 4Fe4S-binding SPASM domain